MDLFITEQKGHSRKIGIAKAQIVRDSLQEALEEADSLLRSMEIESAKMSLQRTLSHPAKVSASFQAKLSQRLSQPLIRESHGKPRQRHSSTGFAPQTQMKRSSGNSAKRTTKLRRPGVECSDPQDPNYSTQISLQVFEPKSVLNDPLLHTTN